MTQERKTANNIYFLSITGFHTPIFQMTPLNVDSAGMWMAKNCTPFPADFRSAIIRECPPPPHPAVNHMISKKSERLLCEQIGFGVFLCHFVFVGLCMQNNQGCTLMNLPLFGA